MMKDLQLYLKASLEKLRNVSRQAGRYGVVIFLVFIIGLYGFVILRIQSLSNTEPTEEAINSQVEAAHAPHIDQQVIDQLQSLQDNSVNVQTLFDQARSNPFQ